MKKITQYRQGDVLLTRVTEVPIGIQREREGGRHILAHGEATGHAHAISDPDVEVLVSGAGEVFVLVPGDGATLRHEEHAAVTIPPGHYRVTRQREYSPEEIRNVAD